MAWASMVLLIGFFLSFLLFSSLMFEFCNSLQFLVLFYLDSLPFVFVYFCLAFPDGSTPLFFFGLESKRC